MPANVDASKLIIQQHIDAFFQFVYPAGTFNFMHRGSFLRAWHNGNMSRSLLRTVAGVASRFMDLAHHEGENAASTLPGPEWTNEAEREICRDLDLLSIPKLQILLLLIFDRMATGRASVVWFLLSLAARLAHGLKLNISTEAVAFTNQECRRRLIWCIYCLDKLASTDLNTGASYPPLCPLPWIEVQLPCDERSFELEFECKTPSLNDLANNLYGNPAKLGATAYLIRIIDLRQQIHVFCLKHHDQNAPRPWDGDSDFWRIRQELTDISAHFPPEMQDSERAIYIRANTPESNVYIMVQTWLRTSWCELVGHFLLQPLPSDPNVVTTTTGTILLAEQQASMPQEFVSLCRTLLAHHALGLQQFWSRIQATQGLSRRFFVTDWNIAPCVVQNTRALMYIWDAAPDLIRNDKSVLESATRLNMEILEPLAGVSQYVACWVSPILLHILLYYAVTIMIPMMASSDTINRKSIWGVFFGTHFLT